MLTALLGTLRPLNCLIWHTQRIHRCEFFSRFLRTRSFLFFLLALRGKKNSAKLAVQSIAAAWVKQLLGHSFFFTSIRTT
jgi:hypothetical protein